MSKPTVLHNYDENNKAKPLASFFDRKKYACGATTTTLGC